MVSQIHRDTANAIVSRQRFGFRTRQVENDVTVDASGTLIARNNPDRIFLMVVVQGSGGLYVQRRLDLATDTGVPLSTQYSAATWETDLDGEATGYERWGRLFSTLSSLVVTVIETIRVREEE